MQNPWGHGTMAGRRGAHIADVSEFSVCEPQVPTREVLVIAPGLVQSDFHGEGEVLMMSRCLYPHAARPEYSDMSIRCIKGREA